ncbi:diphthamide synthesis protein [Candidatus Woesearchaeota archaeon]|nr:diphthamide synthesis protein [Candidatus Woesearchaeota archaeon]
MTTVKTVFIEARYRRVIRLTESQMRKLPARVLLLASVQFLGSLPGIWEQLERSGRIGVLPRLRHAAHDGQLLGCNIADMRKMAFDAILYVGDGAFHPHTLVLKNDRQVFRLDPRSRRMREVPSAEVREMRRRMNAALLSFHRADRVGVLVTAKPGQERLEAALRLRTAYPEKEFFYLVADTLDLASLEDFPFLQCLVNTACPRIGYEDHAAAPRPVINLDEVLDTVF